MRHVINPCIGVLSEDGAGHNFDIKMPLGTRKSIQEGTGTGTRYVAEAVLALLLPLPQPRRNTDKNCPLASGESELRLSGRFASDNRTQAAEVVPVAMAPRCPPPQLLCGRTHTALAS